MILLRGVKINVVSELDIANVIEFIVRFIVYIHPECVDV